MRDNKYKVEYINMKKRKITMFTKNNWDGWMDGWMDEQTDVAWSFKGMDGWMNEETDIAWSFKGIDEWMDGWMNE